MNPDGAKLHILKLSQQIEVNPDYALNYFIRGNAYFELGSYHDALLDYNRAIELSPNSAMYGNRGLVHNLIHSYDEAIFDYNKAIEFDPENIGAYFNRGWLFLHLKSHKNALSDFNRIIELNPAYANAYNARGNVLIELNSYREALSDYNKAIELNPVYANAYTGRGHAYRGLKAYREALLDYNKAIELNPDDVNAYRGRASVYTINKLHEDAFADYDKAIDIDKFDATTYLNRGVIYAESGDREKALIDYNKALELNPYDWMIYNNRGNTYTELKKYTDALSDYSKALELNPNNAMVYMNRGAIGVCLENYQEALADYNNAIRLNANLDAAYRNRGIVNTRLKLYQEAISDYNKAIELDPTEASSYFHRGVLFQLRDDTFQVIKDFSTYLYLCVRRKKIKHTTWLIECFSGNYPMNINTMYEIFPDISTTFILQPLKQVFDKVHDVLLLLQYYEKKQYFTQRDFLSITAILHYYLGGRVSAYIIYDEKLDVCDIRLTSQELYYYALSACDVSIEWKTILNNCLEEFQVRSPEDNYYNGLLWLLNGEREKAFECFQGSRSFLFSRIMLAALGNNSSSDTIDIEMLHKEWKIQTELMCTNIDIEARSLTQFEFFFHCKECQNALMAKYYDSTPEQNLAYNNFWVDFNEFCAMKAFWEIFSLSEKSAEYLRGEIQKVELEEMMVAIKVNFKNIIDKCVLDGAKRLIDLYGRVLTKERKDVRNLAEKLDKSSDIENELGLAIEDWDIQNPKVYALFINYFYQSRSLDSEQAFSLFFYLYHVHKEGRKSRGIAAKDFATESLKDLSDFYLPLKILHSVFYLIKRAKPLFETFDGRDIIDYVPRNNTDYKNYKDELWRYIGQDKSDLSPEKFERKYQIFSWFENYQING